MKTKTFLRFGPVFALLLGLAACNSGPSQSPAVPGTTTGPEAPPATASERSASDKLIAVYPERSAQLIRQEDGGICNRMGAVARKFNPEVSGKGYDAPREAYAEAAKMPLLRQEIRNGLSTVILSKLSMLSLDDRAAQEYIEGGCRAVRS